MIEGGLINKFCTFCIQKRLWVVMLLAISTLALSYSALNVQVRTVFSDMLPSSHPYVKTHEEFKDTFGGSNMVTIMLEVKEGDIFQVEFLKKVQKLTLELRQVTGVNDFQITSIASKKLKEISASTDGIDTNPLMWPEVPTSQDAIDNLRKSVVKNGLVYGNYVSTDLKSTLVTVDFIDRLVDYDKIAVEINEIIDSLKDDSFNVHMVGEPILFGWVNHYLPETVHLILLAVAVMVILLFLFMRSWHGMLLPLLAGLISAIWALGIINLLGINFEPLVVVVAMLISARAVSHSVQIINRFDEEVGSNPETRETALRSGQIALTDMFRPGMLGILSDAGCIAVVALSPIPLLQKLTVLAVVWVGTLSVSAVILTPVLLSWGLHPKGSAHRFDLAPLVNRFLGFCSAVVLSKGRFWILGGSFVLFCFAAYFSFNLKVGDANPGSPILWPDAQYNVDSRVINERYQGSDRMFVVVEGDGADYLKKTEVLTNIENFQRYMEAQPEVGGSISLSDVVPAINRILHEGNPRYQEVGENELVNGSLMYLFQTVSDPGDLDQFTDNRYEHGAVTLFFRDRQGETIHSAISRIKEYTSENPLEDGEYRLAGGVVGVLAAVNEIIFSSQVEAIALALVVLVALCSLTYRSMSAGMLFMVPVILSNAVTFSAMSFLGIGMNINTVPIAALGIGLGVDYGLYIADRMKEEHLLGRTPEQCVTSALSSSGYGVVVTAVVLVACVLIWGLSSLRFQAEMGILMAIWLGFSALSALLLVPSMIYVFKPKFIFGNTKKPVLTSSVI